MRIRKARKEMTTMETFSNLIDLDSYSPDEWNMIVELAQQIQKNPALYRSRCSGKIMGTLFKNADEFSDCNAEARRHDNRI